MSWKFFFQVGWLEFSIGFSLFILAPLLIEEVVQTTEGDLAERWLWSVMKCSHPFALAVALSLTVSTGLEAVAWSSVWLVYTLLVAYGGVVRMLGRGKRGLEEWSIDAGLIYLG